MSVVDGLPFADEKKKYILEVLDPMLEEMVSDVLAEMPPKPLDFMVAWLQKRSGLPLSGKVSVKTKNKMLKQELGHFMDSLGEASSGIALGSKAEDDEEEEEDDDDDDCDEIPESFRKAEATFNTARQSVSAEAYGTWNEKKAFTPPKHEKTPEQEERLKGTLMKSFMFNNLDSKDMDICVLAMKEVKFKQEEKAILEGEDGDFLFVIESGQLDCIKTIDGEEKVVKTCSPGDVFGELALLYNCPRAASVVAKETSICWQLDRESFNHIVKDAAVKRRNKYDSFLKSVAIFSNFSAYERSQISDCLKSETFKEGECIVKQDEPGDKFYIIEAGSLYAEKDLLGKKDRVMEYKVGDYFGELALLKNQPRAASVKVASETCQVLSMSRLSFNKMLGPLQSILRKGYE